MGKKMLLPVDRLSSNQLQCQPLMQTSVKLSLASVLPTLQLNYMFLGPAPFSISDLINQPELSINHAKNNLLSIALLHNTTTTLTTQRSTSKNVTKTFLKTYKFGVQNGLWR